eukprot:TRINITY_DN4803_c0_g1_i2.p1 TRINITY_DN4803_c0_g1~~TRINITY_DN4803_c0_g1_i2.p1  ORF type:complete len:197 (-),score=44.23 TRINITY_DN4803_c0_g1_i2:263-826(-)
MAQLPMSVAAAATAPTAPAAGLSAGSVPPLQVLSRRLSAAHLQRHDAVFPEPAVEGPAPLCVVSAGGGLKLSERSHALGEALRKKSKLLETPAAAALAAGPQPLSAVVPAEEASLRRNRLSGWMELAVQHAPSSKQSRQARALPGGLQEAYGSSVRHHLTEARALIQWHPGGARQLYSWLWRRFMKV